MRARRHVTPLTLAVSLSVIVSSPATASLLSSADQEGADGVGRAAESIVLPETSPDREAPGATGERSTAEGSDESGAGPGAWLGLPLEVDASGQLVPGLPPPALLTEQPACGPVTDPCADPTGPQASGRLRALARDLGILALFAAGLLVLARVIRRLA